MLPFSRRSFLSSSAALTAGVALASSARAIEPIARNGKAKFKFSLAAYSYRDLLSGMAPKLTMNDFVSECAKFQLDGTELTSYYFPKIVTHDYLRSVAQQCFRLGLDVSGTAIGNEFGHPPGEKRLGEIAKAKQWIDFAAILGAPVIRIFAGHEQPGSTPAQAHSLMVSAIEECCEYAGKHGIYLALENHGGPTATAEGLLSFVRDVSSPWFGVNLDTGNFASADVYGDLAKAAPYAVNVQIKVVVSDDKGKKSEADFKKLAALLREAHYRGYIVLEFEEKGDPREECPKYLDQLREAFA
ncbi:MAG: sugar phosphate isomerase/epimerase family protein [Pirellulaceae bacterium]